MLTGQEIFLGLLFIPKILLTGQFFKKRAQEKQRSLTYFCIRADFLLSILASDHAESLKLFFIVLFCDDIGGKSCFYLFTLLFNVKKYIFLAWEVWKDFSVLNEISWDEDFYISLNKCRRMVIITTLMLYLERLTKIFLFFIGMIFYR